MLPDLSVALSRGRCSGPGVPERCARQRGMGEVCRPLDMTRLALAGHSWLGYLSASSGLAEHNTRAFSVRPHDGRRGAMAPARRREPELDSKSRPSYVAAPPLFHTQPNGCVNYDDDDYLYHLERETRQPSSGGQPFSCEVRPLLRRTLLANHRTKITTLCGGSLGSCVDEERSQLRELM